MTDKSLLSVSQLYLEEQRFSQREAQRTLGQRVRLYLLRFVLNVTVVCLLAGAFCLIYYATKVSQNEVRHLRDSLSSGGRRERNAELSVSEWTPQACQPLPAVPAPHHHHLGQPVPTPSLPQDLLL